MNRAVWHGGEFALRLLLMLLLGFELAACSTPLERQIRDNNLQQSVRTGTTYDHLVLSSRSRPDGGSLHVYIEGDGRPWIDGLRPADDPTPKHMLALELMLLDDAASVYVGRPCYFGERAQPACTAEDWTSGRYSDKVIASMTKLIAELGAGGDYDGVLLFGYSGGGTIARLVAARLPAAVAVIGVAANLDVRAWTTAHDYLPLENSLDPALEVPLPHRVLHVQMIGGRDKVVPPSVTESYRATGQALEIWSFEGFDHRCCWVDAWPDILTRVARTVAAHERNLASN
ncbi:MAG TPA: alpha/beta hydrolase [Woeseiaceae bacterium]|nr:alpha/beta hydrolase [Woeseiaceae bacterium]